MKIKINRKKRLIIVLTAVVLIAGGSIATWYFLAGPGKTEKSSLQQTKDIDNTSSVEENQVRDNQTDDALPNKNDESDRPVVPTDTASNPAVQPEKPRIERASGDPQIRVVATLQQQSTGYCELTLSNGTTTRSETSQIIVSASYYVCSFDIPRESLQPQTGWSVTVTHHLNGISTSSDVVNI